MTHATRFPPPWKLSGDGVIMLYRPGQAWLEARPKGWSGRLAVVMWVNYHTSPVGPYREWLMIPGRKENPRGKHYSIKDIYVDSHESMVNGQQNWGIPKRYADFNWTGDGSALNLCLNAPPLNVQLSGVCKGPALPVPALWHPYSLYQRRSGSHFWTRPTATGRCRWFTVSNQQEGGAEAPGLSAEKIVAGFAIQNFKMTFPLASTQGAGNGGGQGER